jgi:CDGSH iron-sulfur domain-containing protein 3
MTVRIKIRENGPYKVEGPIEIVDHEGNAVEVPTGDVAVLCRCGGSSTKPFCDGTHSKTGFHGAIRAVEESRDAA